MISPGKNLRLFYVLVPLTAIGIGVWCKFVTLIIMGTFILLANFATSRGRRAGILPQQNLVLAILARISRRFTGR
jgi:hypothetical protein